jgi:hypothetical protein
MDRLEREARFAEVPTSEPEKGGWDLFVKQAGSYKSNLGPELAKEIANSRPQNKPGFIPPLPANPPPGAAQVIRNLPAFENAMKAFRGIGILPPEVPAKAPAKKPAKGKKMNEETKPIRTAETP